MIAPRRPLDEMLTELVAGLGTIGAGGSQLYAATGVVPSSVVLDLPVEAGIEHRDGRWVVLADSPRTRLRTDFDRPTGRLTARIVLESGA